MANNSSATARLETPYANRTSRTNTLMDALVRRTQAVLNDDSIDAQSRARIRYALEVNDPWLARLVKRAEASENNVDSAELSQTLNVNEDASSREKIEALAEVICGAGAECAGALLVLMKTLEDSTHPKVLAHTAKHFAFTRCGELNVHGMVDIQIAMLEGELLRGDTPV